MVEVVDVAAHVTEELIPSMLEGIELGFVTEMPFAEYAASISAFEGRRKYGLLRRQAEAAVFLPIRLPLRNVPRCPFLWRIPIRLLFAGICRSGERFGWGYTLDHWRNVE